MQFEDLEVRQSTSFVENRLVADFEKLNCEIFGRAFLSTRISNSVQGSGKLVQTLSKIKETGSPALTFSQQPLQRQWEVLPEPVAL